MSTLIKVSLEPPTKELGKNVNIISARVLKLLPNWEVTQLHDGSSIRTRFRKIAEGDDQLTVNLDRNSPVWFYGELIGIENDDYVLLIIINDDRERITIKKGEDYVFFTTPTNAGGKSARFKKSRKSTRFRKSFKKHRKSSHCRKSKKHRKSSH